MADNFLGTASEFASWVPTVTGKLSYSVIGRTDWPRRCIYANQLHTPEHCFGIFLQERFNHDIVTPFISLSDRQKHYLFSWFQFKGAKPLIGRHFFVALADAGNQDNLGNLDEIQGTLHVIPATPTGTEFYSELKARILPLSKSKMTAKDIADLREDVSRASPLDCIFSLKRNGEFLLTQQRLNQVEGFGLIGDSEADRYSSQMYYFLRDIVHNHQHHDPENDLVVRLHKIGQRDWKDLVYFDLYRRVIRFKRIRTDFHITNATGILAYARTFKKIFKPPSGAGQFYEQHTVQSLETAKYELQLKQLRRSNFIATTQALIFGFASVLFGTVALANFADKDVLKSFIVSGSIIDLTKFIAAEPFFTFCAIILIAALFSKSIGYSRPEKRGYIKDTLRVFQYYEKGTSVALQLGIGTTLISISLILLYLF